MTKAEIIAKYGEEGYEAYKERCRRNYHAYYHKNMDKEKQRYAKYRADHAQEKRAYNRKCANVVRINCRDRNRLMRMGKIGKGQVVHHMKYHSDNADKTWIDDIIIMTQEEHVLWHMAHPEFIANENVI